jgi:hypothetical protein
MHGIDPIRIKSRMSKVRSISGPRLCRTLIDVADDSSRWMINLNMHRCFSPRDDVPLNSSFHLILLDRSRCRGWTIMHRSHYSGSREYMCRWSFTIILHVLKDLLAKFFITWTLKDGQITWLGFIEGILTSFHD